MPPIAPGHPCLILDACCVINPAASGRLSDVLRALEQDLAIAEFVHTNEALRTPRTDLQRVVQSRLLKVIPLTPEEEETAAQWAPQNLDDDEAVTGAIAQHRAWAIVTDDWKATSFIRRVVPQLLIVTTPELIKHWVDFSIPSFGEVRSALRQIRAGARYFPPELHPLRPWWDQFA